MHPTSSCTKKAHFTALKSSRHFQADPDAVLVICADSGHPFTLVIITHNHRVRHKMGRIGACLAPVYLVHVRHGTGVAFPVAL